MVKKLGILEIGGPVCKVAITPSGTCQDQSCRFLSSATDYFPNHTLLVGL